MFFLHHPQLYCFLSYLLSIYYQYSFTTLELDQGDFDRINKSLLNTVLDDNHHQSFKSFAHHMCFDSIFQNELTLIHRMSHPLSRPQFLDPKSVNSTAKETITNDFLSEAGIRPPGPNDTPAMPLHEIINTIRETMQHASFPQDDIDEVVRTFSTESISPLLASPSANDLARSFGFPDLASLTLLSQSSDSQRAQKGVVAFSMTTEYLVTLLKANAGITDEPDAFLDQQARDFVNLSKGIRSAPSPTTITARRLMQIRKNTAHNGQSLFELQPRTVSLQNYAHKAIYPARVIPLKDIKTVIKLASKQPSPRDVTSSAPAAPFVFNCFR